MRKIFVTRKQMGLFTNETKLQVNQEHYQKICISKIVAHIIEGTKIISY